MSESDRGNELDLYDCWNNITLPKKRVGHLDLWAEDTFELLSNHTRRQRKRQKRLETDLGELMETFDELTDTYLD